TRTPMKLPRIEIAKKPFFDIQFDDIKLINYRHHEFIKFPIAV
ncbi:MAG: thymidylate synthase, partial [Planctomycetes bacterium]|nr:thymidylate synthase [Planctomycetota bacterium]